MRTKKPKATTAPSPSSAAPTATPSGGEGRKRPRVLRGGSARLAPRALGSGAPPKGSLDRDAVDVAVLKFTKRGVGVRADYISYGNDKLLEDVRKVLRGADEDLPLFAGSPITMRDFAWLTSLAEALVEIAEIEREHEATRQQLERESTFAVGEVRKRRTQVSRDMQASGIPSLLVRADGGTANPRRLASESAIAAKAARRHLAEFESPVDARVHIEELEEANLLLTGVVEGKLDLAAAEVRLAGRRAALRRLTYDALTYIAGWGRSKVGDDPTKGDRYRLEHLFPRKKKKKAEKPTE